MMGMFQLHKPIFKITTTFVVLLTIDILSWPSLFVQASYYSSSYSATSSYQHQQHRDDAYYPAGTENPLIQTQKMYWRDAINVLEDLGLFESLAVKFESCVWSPSRSSNNNGNNYNNNNHDDEDNWYMGMFPPEEANVAFSLYGKLKANTTRHRKSGKSTRICTSQHYINSFYTVGGFEVFLQSLAAANIQRFDKYSNENDYYKNYVLGYTAACVGGYTVSCTDSSNFAVYKYGISSLASESTCHGSTRNHEVDNLQQLNDDINAGVKCVEIYNDIDQGPYVDTSDPTGSAVSLLTYSSACTLNDPIGKCPDPYGQLRVNERAYKRGATLRNDGLEYRIRVFKSVCVLLLGIACLYVAYKIYIKEGDFVEKDKMTFQQFFRGSSPKRVLGVSNNDIDDDNDMPKSRKRSPRISTKNKKNSEASISSSKSSRGRERSSSSKGSFSPRRKKQPHNTDNNDGFENPYDALEAGNVNKEIDLTLDDLDDHDNDAKQSYYDEYEEQEDDKEYEEQEEDDDDDEYEHQEEEDDDDSDGDDDESDEFGNSTGENSFAQQKAENRWSVFEKMLRKLENCTTGWKDKKSRDSKDIKAEPLLVTDGQYNVTEKQHQISETQLVETNKGVPGDRHDLDTSNAYHRSRKNTQDSGSSKENSTKEVNRKSVRKWIGKLVRRKYKRQLDEMKDEIQRDDNDSAG